MKKIVILALAMSTAALAQYVPFGFTAAAGGGSTKVLIDHGIGRSTTQTGTATTSTMNGSSCTTGCFAAACVANFDNDPSTATMGSSGITGGTWAHGTTQFTLNHGYVTPFYLYNITSITSTATITANAHAGSGGYTGVAAAIFSNVATSSPLDTQTGIATAAGTAQPGSATPGGNGELGISCEAIQATSGSPTISGSGYAVLNVQAADGTVNLTFGLSYVIQTTATAANPTWSFTTLTSNVGGGIAQVFFK